MEVKIFGKSQKLNTSQPEEQTGEKKVHTLKAHIQAARQKVNTEPTPAQKESGNYSKGHVTIQGLNIAIENPKGSTRRGTDKNGKAWQTKLTHDYGYFKKTEGADQDHVDCFIGEHPESELVFIINQQEPDTKIFDEHKVMIGFNNEDEAKQGYLSNYQGDATKRIQSIKPMHMAEFKEWLKTGDTTQPITKSFIQNIIYVLGKAVKNVSQLGLFSESEATVKPEGQTDHYEGETRYVDGKAYTLKGKPGKKRWRAQEAPQAAIFGKPIGVDGSAPERPAKQKAKPQEPLSFDTLNIGDELKHTGSDAKYIVKTKIKGQWGRKNTVATVPAENPNALPEVIQDYSAWERYNETAPEEDESPATTEVNNEIQQVLSENNKSKAQQEETPKEEPYKNDLNLYDQPEPEPRPTEKQPEPKEDSYIAPIVETEEIISGRKRRQEINKQVIELFNSKNDEEMTPDDIKLLSLYSGRGGTDDYSINEFYTHPKVARFIWNMMGKLGFKGGHVLEPSCATGVFIQTKPADTLVTGVELSEVSSHIAKLLHPDDAVINTSLEEFAKETEDGTFDASVGNYPFGTRGYERSKHKSEITKNETYFLDTAIDLTREGGIISCIVPTRVMENGDQKKFRQSICERAEFLGAVRLPNTAFKHTGTSVTTDIIFLRKHPDVVTDAILSAKAKDDFGRLRESGIMNQEFINGNYFEGTGKEYIWGEETTGNWGSTAVKGRVTDELIENTLNKPFESKVKYEMFAQNETDTKYIQNALEQKELYVGMTITGANGVTYRLNENHRWERVESEEQTKQRKLNISFEDYGIGTRDEFHEKMNDLTFRSELTGDQLDKAIDYMSVVSISDFQEAKEIHAGLVEAKRISQLAATPEEAQRYFAAALVGNEIYNQQKRLERGLQPDYQMFEKLTLLLEEYKEQYGNPNNDKHFVSTAANTTTLSRVLGAFTPEGNLSDFMLRPEEYVKQQQSKDLDRGNVTAVVKYLSKDGKYASVKDIAAYWSQAAGKSDQEIEAILLSDETIGFDGEQFVPMEKLLSGTIYDKLETWDKLSRELDSSNDINAGLKKNKIDQQADKLRSLATYKEIEVLPVAMTAKWIPLELRNEFLQMKGFKKLQYFYNTNSYEVDYSSQGAAPTYGKDGNLYGDLIMVLNNKGLKHGSQNEDREEVLKEFDESFHNWLASHKRRDEIEKQYNKLFNNYLSETYDDSPIQIDKIADGFDLNRYHYAAMRKLCDKGKGILAYDTGLGKTYAAIATALLRKQRGEIKKPLAVVPKSVIGNWFKEFNKLTNGKNAKIIVVGMTQKFDPDGNAILDSDGLPVFTEDDSDTVHMKLQQVAQNDFDLVLMTRDKLNYMNLSENRMKNYLGDIVTKHIMTSDVSDEALGAEEKKGKGKKGYDEESKKASLMAYYATRLSEGHEKFESITFDSLGVDCMFVDEGHNYKNLYGLTGRNMVRFAMQMPDTQRSMRLAMFSRYIMEQNNNKNMYLLTATPTVNNPLESYNMLQYIAPEKFDERNINNIVDFYNHFGKTEMREIPQTSGKIEIEECLVGFKNAKELRSIFNEFTYFKTADDVKLKMVNANYANQYSTMTDLQKQVYTQLRKRALDMAKNNKDLDPEDQDHIWSVIWDMQKATLSLDLLRRTGSKYAPKLTEEEVRKDGVSPKIKQYVEDAVNVYNNGEKHIAFCQYKECQEEIKRELIKAGVKPEHIFVANAETLPKSNDRLKLSQNFNKGKYRIVIGNEVLSEGLNLQEGTEGVRHLTIPRTPGAMQQINGRVIRQGNKRAEANVHTYMTAGSYDQFLLEALTRKAGWNRAFWMGNEDEAVNLDTGMGMDMDELGVMLSDDPEAERFRVEARKANAMENLRTEKKSKALSHFVQYQNYVTQYDRMTDKEKTEANGINTLDRINSLKGSLAGNDYFEHKGLLENFKPAYIDKKTGVIIPQGKLFSIGKGEAKRTYRIVHVDPVEQKLMVEKVHRAEDERRDATGERLVLSYSNFKEQTKHGIKNVDIPAEKIEEYIMKDMDGIKHARMLSPKTIIENKAKIIQGSYEVPVRDPAGELQIVSGKYFKPAPDYLVKAAESEPESRKKSYNSYTEQLKEYNRNLDEVFLPTDPEKWNKEILLKAYKNAMDVMKRRTENSYERRKYGSIQKQIMTMNHGRDSEGFIFFAQMCFGENWFHQARLVAQSAGQEIKIGEKE